MKFGCFGPLSLDAALIIGVSEDLQLYSLFLVGSLSSHRFYTTKRPVGLVVVDLAVVAAAPVVP